MFGRLGKIVIIIIFLSSCDNDFFPAGIYDYQVERLLASDTSKVWNQQVNAPDCSGASNLLIEFIGNTIDDSIRISNLRLSAACNVMDTILLGNADASSFTESPLFTDSLNFSDGSFWIVENVTSQTLRVRIGGNVSTYEVNGL